MGPETPTPPVALLKGRLSTSTPCTVPPADGGVISSALPQEPAAAPSLPLFVSPERGNSYASAPRRYAWAAESPEATSHRQVASALARESRCGLASLFDSGASFESRDRLLTTPAMPEREAPRVEHVRWWIRQQGWVNQPFDKLVLHLDRLGIELSIAEQDHLKH